MQDSNNGNILNLAIERFRIRIDTDPRKWLILLAVCEKNIVRYILLLFSMIPVIDNLKEVILHFAYFVLIILCFQKHRIIIYVKETFLLLFVVMFIMGTCIIYPDNAKYIFERNQFWQIIFPCLRYFIVGLAFIADKKIMDMVGRASCWGILIETFFVFAYMRPNGLLVTEDMNRAYQLLPNILLAINYSFNNRKKLIWIMPVIGILYLLAMGSRGPIVIALVYFLVALIINGSPRKWIKYADIALIIAVIALFFYFKFYITFLMLLQNLFIKAGLSIRILNFASSSTMFSYTSGRDELYVIALEKIKENPFFGYGIYGEWKWFGWNAHNLYLELMLNFGIPIALVIFLWGVSIIIRSAARNQNKYAVNFIVIFTCFVLVKSFFGGTFFDKWLFFLLGFCIQEMRRISLNMTIKSTAH